MYNDIEVCNVCHFRLPRVFGYVGTIRCNCGKVVYTTETYTYKGESRPMSIGFKILKEYQQ
jgi:hypothetical protein